MNLLIYPEGTRRLSNELCRLKSVFIEFAHNNKLPVQICISTNKEHVLSDQANITNKNVDIITEYSSLIDPSNYSYYDFYDEISSQ